MEINLRDWDNGNRREKEKFMENMLLRYSIDGVEEFDVGKLEEELFQSICLILTRIIASLEKYIKHDQSYVLHLKCIGMLLSTASAQNFALNSTNMLPIILRCIDYEYKTQEPNFVAALDVLQKMTVYSDKLRLALVNLKCIAMVEALLLHFYNSRELHSFGTSLILNLASIDVMDHTFEFVSVIKSFLSSPHLQPKHSAITMFSSVLSRRSSVVLNLGNWENVFVQHLSRLFLCSPLTYQYDTTELLSLLLIDNDNSRYANSIIKLCGTVLCLRYTVGGSSLLTVKDSSELKIKSSIPEENTVSEIPEILVCAIITSALNVAKEEYVREGTSGVSNFDSSNVSSTLTCDTTLQQMRHGNLHYVFLAHILWFIREKVVLRKIIDTWTPSVETYADNDSNKYFDRSNSSSPDRQSSTGTRGSPATNKYRRAVKLTKRWLARRRRTRTSMLKSQTHFLSHVVHTDLSNNGDEAVESIEMKTQELCCGHVVRVLDQWMEVDAYANQDIVETLQSFGYTQQIVLKHERSEQSQSSEILADDKSTLHAPLDVSITFANIAYVCANVNSGYSTNIMTNMSQLSVLVAPGTCIRELKSDLLASLNHTSINSFSSTSDGNNSSRNSLPQAGTVSASSLGDAYGESLSLGHSVLQPLHDTCSNINSTKIQKEEALIISNTSQREFSVTNTLPNSNFLKLPPAPKASHMAQKSNSDLPPLKRNNRYGSPTKSYQCEVVVSYNPPDAHYMTRNVDISKDRERHTIPTCDSSSVLRAIKPNVVPSEIYVLRSGVNPSAAKEKNVSISIPGVISAKVPSPPKELRGVVDGQPDSQPHGIKPSSTSMRVGRYKVSSKESNEKNIINNLLPPPGYIDVSLIDNDPETLQLRKLNDIVTNMIDECEHIYNETLVANHIEEKETVPVSRHNYGQLHTSEYVADKGGDPLISPRGTILKRTAHAPNEPRSGAQGRSPHKNAFKSLQTTNAHAVPNVSNILLAKEFDYDNGNSPTSAPNCVVPLDSPPKPRYSKEKTDLTSYLKQMIAEESELAG